MRRNVGEALKMRDMFEEIQLVNNDDWLRE